MVTVFGLGFVGLTTALGFAHMGYQVFGIEPDRHRREQLASGRIPFLEPGLEQILNETIGKTFFITSDVEKAIEQSTYCFYCVGTPYGKDGQADLSQLFNALDETMHQLKSIQDKKFRILCVKSTVPPATAEERVFPYIKKQYESMEQELGLVSNPEFLREGHCWDDFVHADRIVIGCNDLRSEDLMKKLYEPMNCPIISVSQSTAEFIKYLSNTFLATMISYSNEMALMAEHMGGIDVKRAFEALHMDKRWNDCNMKSYVYPGCGYGGYCLPKDTNALYAQAKTKGFYSEILHQVICLNDSMPQKIAERIASYTSDKQQTIGILGLSFKPLSSDVRDSSAAKIIQCLLNEGYTNILAYDPVAMEEFNRYYQLPIVYCKTLEEIRGKSDVCGIITAWPEFQALSEWMDKKIVDGRYML